MMKTYIKNKRHYEVTIIKWDIVIKVQVFKYLL